jgi:hypothetical protein
LGIIIAFSGKGASLYFARVIMIKIAAQIGGKIQQHVRHAVEANEFSTPANRRATPRPHQVPASQAEETYDDTDSDDDDQLE